MNSEKKQLKIEIESMRAEDWAQVSSIYLEGIESGNATFETSVPSWEDWQAAHVEGCSLVARSGDSILGWVALSQVSPRAVYSGVAEVSIYVGENYKGQGVGKRLLNSVIEISEEKGFWTLQAGIFVENVASLTLHKKCGFREVGRRERIAQLHGIWRDTVLLEKRSQY